MSWEIDFLKDKILRSTERKYFKIQLHKIWIHKKKKKKSNYNIFVLHIDGMNHAKNVKPTKHITFF